MPLVTASSADQRSRALRGLADLPPFSPVLNRLLATLASEEASLSTVAGIIEKDTIIAGNVLKQVNSAMYGRRSEVSSLRHAASLLGMSRLRNVVLSMSVSRMWNQAKTPPDWSTARFNLHSAGVAVMADLLAQRVNVEYPEGAFLAGLFHDIGRLLIALTLRAEYDQIVTLHAASAQSWVECEQEVLGFSHADLSASAVESWRLPAPVHHAVAWHHAPEQQVDQVRLGTLPLASLLNAADVAVNNAGISIEKKRLPSASPPEETFDALGIASHTAELMEEFTTEYGTLTQFFR